MSLGYRRVSSSGLVLKSLHARLAGRCTVITFVKPKRISMLITMQAPEKDSAYKPVALGDDSFDSKPSEITVPSVIADTVGQAGETGKDESGADFDDDVALTFPQRLMEILDDEENSGVISWLPHGRGFAIFKKKAFERILPKFFGGKQSKYSSFTRKLNRWGFTRVTRGPEAGAYFHQLFRRDGHRLVMQMSCQSSVKGHEVSVAKSVPTPSYPAGAQSELAIGGALESERAMILQQKHFLQLQIQQQAEQQLLQEMLRRALLNQQLLQQRTHPSPELLYAQMIGANAMSAGSLSGVGAPGVLNSRTGGRIRSPSSNVLENLVWRNPSA